MQTQLQQEEAPEEMATRMHTRGVNWAGKDSVTDPNAGREGTMTVLGRKREEREAEREGLLRYPHRRLVYIGILLGTGECSAEDGELS